MASDTDAGLGHRYLLHRESESRNILVNVHYCSGEKTQKLDNRDIEEGVWLGHFHYCTAPILSPSIVLRYISSASLRGDEDKSDRDCLAKSFR